MREFFGLIIFVILICIWSWVFADSNEKISSKNSNSNLPHIEVVQGNSSK